MASRLPGYKRLQEIIRSHFSSLKAELDVKCILAEMFAAKLVEMDLKTKLKNECVPEEAAELFLDNLYRIVDENKFDSFVQILEDSERPRHTELAAMLKSSKNKVKPVQHITRSASTVESPEKPNISSVGKSLSDNVVMAPSEAECGPNNSTSEIYSPDDEDHKEFDEPDHPCELDSYEHPGKDMSENDESDSEDESASPGSDQGGSQERLEGVPNVSESSNPVPVVTDPEPKPPWSGELQTLNESNLKVSTKSSNKLPINPALLGLVCPQCCKPPPAPPRAGTCKFTHHSKIMLVKADSTFVAVRAKSRNSQLILCHNLPSCSYKEGCRYAHSTAELEVWRDLTAPPYESCLECQWNRLSGLLHKECYERSKHATIPRIMVYKDEEKRVLIKIRFPCNLERMRNKKYFLNHKYVDCHEHNRDQCKFPHGQLEATIWNAWKDKFYSNYARSQLMPTQENFLCEVRRCFPIDSPIAIAETPARQQQSNTSRPVSRMSDHLYVNTQLLGNDLTSENYKNKFGNLIKCEEHTHEEILAKCDGQYDLILDNGYEIEPQYHQWYACIVMDQVKADRLRQAATHVDISFNSWKYRAQILQPQRKIRNKACLLIGFNPIGIEHRDTTFLYGKLQSRDLMLNIHFVLKYSYFRNLSKAVGFLPPTIVQKLVPSKEFMQVEKLKWDSNNNKPNSLLTEELQWKLKDHDQFDLDNRHQLPTCTKLLECPPTLPFIITGPFGTGKTRVIAASAFRILQVERSSRILIAAHHKRTADEYVEKYFTEEIVRKLGIRAVRLLSDNAYYNKRSSLVKKGWMLKQGELKQHRLIITTFITSMHMQNPGQFTHIFIDEGAQAREPESVAAFRFASPQTKIVIAGDHRQVGPRTSVLGEMARKYGLSVSLLERLHALYNHGDMKEMSKSFQAVLLTNYRCHSAILNLPSTLFYSSTIKSNAIDSSHPSWKYPLQFVSTSLVMHPECTWACDKELQEAVVTEVKAIRALVQLCADNWPTSEWGERDLSLLCVITPTRLSERVWKREVYSSELSTVTCTVAYDIQGLEYRAVFLCTSEPVNKDCTPYDPVKSLCDPRVFNTIITRSQSLVIAVGNPFRLMKIEEQMPEGDKHCWLSYFQRCWERNTLILSDEMNKMHVNHSTSLGRLAEIITNEKKCHLNELPNQLQGHTIEDTFELEYSKLFDEERSQSSIPNNFIGWKYGQDVNPQCPIEIHRHQGDDVKECILIEMHPDYCIAKPIDSSGPPIGIFGPNNRKCAFDGATVCVTTLEKKDRGCVTAVLKQGEVQPLVYTVDPDYPRIFLPINKKGIRYLDLKDSEDLLKFRVSSEERLNHHLPRKKFITCFDPKTLKNGPRITHMIPLDVAVQLLFIIQPLSWSAEDPYPRGAAVAVIQKGTSLLLAKHLGQIYQGKYNQDSKGPPNTRENSLMLELKPTTSVQTAQRNVDYTQAIAIMESDNISSCAFSVEHHQGYFNVRVHITNIADSVNLPESIVQGKDPNTPIYMSSQIQSGDVGLTTGFVGTHVRDAITLEYTVEGNCVILSQVQDRGRFISQAKADVHAIRFAESAVHCANLLSLSDLDDLLRSLLSGPASRKKVSEKFNLFDKIAILYIVAKELRKSRLGHDGYKVLSPKLQMSSALYPEAQMIVEEFLIQANYQAAIKLKNSFPEGVLLLKRLCPLPGRKDMLKTISEDSQRMRSIFASEMSESSTPSSLRFQPELDLLVFPSIVTEIMESLRHLDMIALKQALYQLYHHPQCIILFSLLRELLLPEEFYVTDNNNTVSFQEHYIHHLPLYTSFTSPFQCIGDLFVQEGLLAAIRGTEWKRTSEELKTVTKICNVGVSDGDHNDPQVKLPLAFSAQQSSICVEAIILKSQEGGFKLGHFQPAVQDVNFSKVTDFELPKRRASNCYKLRVMSSQGMLLLPFWNQTSNSGPKEEIGVGFIQPTDSAGAFSRVSLRGTAKPNVIGLSKSLLSGLIECFHNPAKSTHMVQELKKILEETIDRKDEPNKASLMFAAFRVPFPAQPYQVSRLWLGCDPTSYILSVQPQCMELAPDVRVCLQHMQHPLACFTQCPTEVASKLAYNSLKEYEQLWQIAVLAVSAELGVSSTTSSLVYKDVLLKFPKFVIPPHILTQEMYTPVGEITASFKQECFSSSSDLFTIGEGDLVCARYEVDLIEVQLSDLLNKYREQILPKDNKVARAILHLVVKKVIPHQENMKVSFEVTGSHPSVSPLMKEILEKNKFTCELEVVSMPHSLRKPYRLLTGGSEPSELARDIAMAVTPNLLKCVGKGDKSYYEAAQEMEYLDMVFQETMRMYSPASLVARRCNKSCEVGGYPIKEGTFMVAPIYGVHYNKEYWPEPEKFDPERFNKENKAKQHPCAYIPFGAGPRQCIGMRLAILQAKMALIEILRKYKFVLPPDVKVPLELNFSITVAPKNDVYLCVESLNPE